MLQIHALQQSLDCFRTHLRVKFVTELFQRVQILLFSQDLLTFQVGHTAFDNHIGFKVQYAFDIAQRQFDVAHTLTAYFSLGHFNAALLTDDATVFQALVLTAQALVIFYRPKDTGAEKAVTFWFERTVVDGFRLFNFTERP